MIFKKDKLIGIDIGPSSVKLVELSTVGREIKLTKFVIEEFPQPPVFSSDEANHFSDRLKAMRKNARFKTRRAIGLIGGTGVLIKYLYLPPAPEKELAKMVRWEVERSGIISPAEAIIDFTVQHEFKDAKGAPRLEILLACAKKSLINSYIKTVENAGFSLQSITVKPQAYSNFFRMQSLTCPNGLVRRVGNSDSKSQIPRLPNGTTKDGGQANPQSQIDWQREVVGMLDIDTAVSNMVIIRHGCTCLFREITVGSKDLIKGIATSLKVSFEEAELLKKKYSFVPDPALAVRDGIQDYQQVPGEPQIKEITLAMRPIREQLVSEIERTLGYFHRQFTTGIINHLFITGDGAGLINLGNFFAESLGLTVNLLNPLQGLNIAQDLPRDINLYAERLTLAIGLANQTKEVHPAIARKDWVHPINLIPPFTERIKEKALTYINQKGLLYITLPFLIPFLILIYFALNQWIKFSEERLRNIQNSPGYYQNFQPDLETVKQELMTKQNQLSQLEQIEKGKIVWWTIFKELKDIGPANNVWLTMIDFNRNAPAGMSIQLSGYGLTSRNVADFNAALSRLANFKKTELISSEKVSFKQGTISEAILFKITIQLSR